MMEISAIGPTELKQPPAYKWPENAGPKDTGKSRFQPYKDGPKENLIKN